MNESEPRLAELIGALSLATDLAAGLAYETALRTSLLAVQLGRALGLQGAALRDVYYTGLLRFIGCTAFAHETARNYGAGDDMGFLRALTPADASKPVDILTHAADAAGPDAGLLQRTAAVLRTMKDPKAGVKLATAHCDLAVALATRLGMSEPVVTSLGQIYERFDGKGAPHGLRGRRIALPARVMHVAWRVEAHRGLEGAPAAVAVVRQRRGAEFDPDVADAFLGAARVHLELLALPSAWDAFLDQEPRPFSTVAPSRVTAVATAFAHYVDLKSPYTLGHSSGVARLAAQAAARMGLPAASCDELQIAGLLHDLGRVSVPNGIWDKPGRLNPVEWERVRQHTYQSERILAQSPLLAPYARLAGLHHERLDASGYHRGLGGSGLAPAARLLAAADMYQALCEDRPHRRALEPQAAARALTAEAAAGRLDREVVARVLAAAGHRSEGQPRGELPASLSPREAEVLCLLAQGLSNKAIAGRLVLSPRTVQHHVEHIYTKTGIRTRAAAAVFAVERDLIARMAGTA